MSNLTNNSNQKYSIIGAGASGIFLTLDLLKKGFLVDLYDHSGGILKKFLIAGKGGLNLTHSDDLNNFIQKYGENKPHFKKYLKNFSNKAMIDWLAKDGIETFIGSSKRVFPKTLTAGDILKIWLDKCQTYPGFSLYSKHSFIDYQDGIILSDEVGKKINLGQKRIVLALGGSSYIKTGSDGHWIKTLSSMGVEIKKMTAINCGYEVGWPEEFKKNTSRKPLKNITLKVDNSLIRGEVLFTDYGIEGSGIYALSRLINEMIEKNNKCDLQIDLKPDLSLQQIKKKLKMPRNKNSYSNFIRKSLNLDGTAYQLLKLNSTKEDFQNLDLLPFLIKNCSIELKRAREIDEAISSAGGVLFKEVNEDLSLKKYPGIFVMGEMLDWDAPTGGYLLQGCISMAAWISEKIKTH